MIQETNREQSPADAAARACISARELTHCACRSERGNYRREPLRTQKDKTSAEI